LRFVIYGRGNLEVFHRNPRIEQASRAHDDENVLAQCRQHRRKWGRAILMREIKRLPPRNLGLEPRVLPADRTEALSEKFKTPGGASVASTPPISDHPSVRTPHRPLRYWAVWLFLVTGTIAVFWPILPALWRIWLDDPDNSHGVLVPLISAALIWGNRRTLQGTEIRPSIWGFVLATFALLLYLAALRTHLALPARIALVLTIIGVVWANFGAPTVKVARFPLFFLMFMIPLPDTFMGLVAFPLQRFASAVSANLLALGGFPVLREGTMLYFPNASLEVAEACSGIRSMASYAVLGLLFAHLGRDGLGARCGTLLVAATVPLALVVNVFRVTGTGILATYLGSRAAQGFLHEFSGFVVFTLGFVLLWALSSILRRRTKRARSDRPQHVLVRAENPR
jgi:exosortase